MNAQEHFGTNADWEIAYQDFPEHYRERITKAFPKISVNWTPIGDLMKDVIDNRTDQRGRLNEYWLAYWLLAYKVLTERKYKAVCVIQADQFVFVNLDVYFNIAHAGILVLAEYPFGFKKAEDLELGDDRFITHRGLIGIFDSINFLSQEYSPIAIDTVLLQAEDAFAMESNHSVTTFNRAVCRHGKKGNILGLDGRLWVADSIWGESKLYLDPNMLRIHNESKNRMRGWHSRWWQEGRAQSEWLRAKDFISKYPGNKEFLIQMDILEHNFNLVKSFMEGFNAMKPEIASPFFLKGEIRRPRYELGEE